MTNMEPNKGEIVMYQPDETIRLEVRMGEETVWLTQQQMAELFDKDRTVISRHIRNIYKEEELEKDITCAKFAHMADLFKATKQNISLHINNIYDEGELERIATVKDYLTVQKEGKRMVNRHVNLYNLDVIISVGYRVKSVRGTRFCQWADLRCLRTDHQPHQAGEEALCLH